MHLRKGNFSEEPQTSGALSHFKWWEQPTSPHLRKIWTGTSPAALELELCTQNPQQSQQSEWTGAEYDLGKRFGSLTLGLLQFHFAIFC